MSRLSRARRGLAALVLSAVVAVAAVASAGPDDRGSAESILRDVDRSARKDVANEMVTRAKGALNRSSRMRAAGDEPHARLADAVARTWAEAARDVVRAAEIEEKAAAARRNAADAGAVADRERALLEEGIAQSGRLRAQLEALDRESKEQPARTNVAGANADAGAKAPPKPAGPKKDVIDMKDVRDAKDGGAR